MPGIYQMLAFAPFWVNGQLVGVPKYVPLWVKIIFILVINIVSNIDLFLFNFITYQNYSVSMHHAIMHYIVLSSWISWYIYVFCEKGRKVKKRGFFHNYINKRLSCFWVYGYCRVATIMSKNINLLFACGAQTIHSMYHHFIPHNK
jgi:hypothetical protein